MKYLIYCTLLICGTFWSCDRSNFDDATLETETFSPIVTEIPDYKWALGIDTLPITIDSSWVSLGIEEDHLRFTGFSSHALSPNPTFFEETYNMEFSAPDGYPMDVGIYDLTMLNQQRSQFNSMTNEWEVLINRQWSGSQIDGILEVTVSEDYYEPFYGAYVREHTGFASGTLTDADGTTHDFTSAFHRLR